jgi:hypothetical protein
MSERGGKDTVIKISGAAVTITNEAAADSGDHQMYQITNAAKQVLDVLTPPTVKVGGTTTVESYTLSYLNGKVTFATVNAGRSAVTVTGKYLPLTSVAYAHVMSTKSAVDMMEVNTFGFDYKKRINGLKFASGSLGQWDVLDTTFTDALLAGVPVVMETRSKSSDSPDRYWALLESRELSAALTDPQNETVTWVSTNEWITQGG